MAGHDHDHDHHHDHHHDHGSELSELQLRVRALETILTEKGYVDPVALDPSSRPTRPRSARVTAPSSSRRPGPTPFQAAAAARRHRGGHFARLGEPGRRPSGGGREHAAAQQHGRLHAVLLLSVGGARPAAGLVQVGAVPLARREGPARRAQRLRHRPAAGHRNPRVGFDCRDAISRAADAAGGHRRLERRPACRLVTRDSMIGTGMPLNPRVRVVMSGITTWAAWTASARSRPSRTSRRSMRLGGPRAGDAARDGLPRLLAYRRFAPCSENVSPVDYLAASHYQRSSLGMESNVLAHGYVREDEIKAGKALRPGKPLPRMLTPDVIPTWPDAQLVLPPAAGPESFKPGDRVRTQEHPSEDAHAAAALRPRQARRGRDVPRLPHVPGFGGDRRWRQSAVALYGGLRQPRAVGRRTPTRR